MIRLSLHPSPASETSAFNKIRALSCCCAALFPFRNSASSRSRSYSAVLVEIDDNWVAETKAYIKWECQDA